ncbi:MAG: hypothetical protein LKI03_05825 [Acetobacter indonesiensis]|jgi:outer membrane protein assembly factor BamE (lipoprotein component of BamABCDE complex)|uniref:hypothetical protein n=1 Tax=Acetobacter indonesiensis TaxID=104101 RepID=UPI000A3B52A2|nr:hypothetical protein [Acetobacter indonesiensis]MCG0995991.1 hypothetical protein [Acetobacter indonesiensis]MCI1437131.1 hypothetical protein [Acetobacter indonesiensis]MCI1546104.1 hypothetical protein [Acetobacter indonesiensis]MCI1765550.1 hypothetical protein [Acetobacter indonesiensis]MCP1230871.1 hypothetical protein [Acetobacter indonesiensis]
MKLSSFAGCLTVLLLLSACSSAGNESIRNETVESVDQKIKDGVTTKQEVRAAYGDPLETSFTDSGHEIWKYSFARMSQNGTNFIPYYGAFTAGSHGKAKTLSVIFNDQVVWHHSLSDSTVQTHQGIGG